MILVPINIFYHINLGLINLSKTSKIKKSFATARRRQLNENKKNMKMILESILVVV